MKKINKAVILCGGRGTRMMPYTKSQPKEMLPVSTTPLLQIIIEQVIETGVKEIFIVIGPEKDCIKKHFDGLYPNVNISFAKQMKMEGTGPATLIAKEFIGNDPFLLIFPDELMIGENPYQVLIDDFNKNQVSVLSSYKIPLEDAHKYGIIITKDGNEIKGIIEKPKLNPPSNYASLGTYILAPDVLNYIEKNNLDGSEICIVDAINMLPRLRHIELTGKRFDLGNPIGFAKANTYIALQNSQEFRNWLKEQL